MNYFTYFINNQTIGQADWKDIGFAAYFNVIKNENKDGEFFNFFSAEDHSWIVHYIDRTIYDEVNNGITIDEKMVTSKMKNTACQIILLWAWWHSSKFWCDKDYIYNNYSKSDFYWTEDAISILKFLIEVEAFKLFGTTGSLSPVDYLKLGKRLNNGRKGSISTHIFVTKGVYIAIDKPDSSRSGLTLAKKALAWIEAATSGNIEVKQDISKVLGNLGFTKKQFFDDTIRYASLLVAGKVVTQKPNPKYLRGKNRTPSIVKMQQIKHGSNPPESVSFSYPVYHDSNKLFLHRIDDVDSKSKSALRVGDWVSSDKKDHGLETDVDAQKFNWAIHMGWMGLSTNGVDRYKLDAVGYNGEFGGGGTIAIRIKEVSGTEKFVCLGEGFPKSVPKVYFKEAQTKFIKLVNGLIDLHKTQKDGPAYNIQPDGIPSSITSLQQLNTFYSKLRDEWAKVVYWKWFDENGVPSDWTYPKGAKKRELESYSFGPADGIAPIENCWSRLLHILANTESQGTPSEILKSQNDYGLKNTSAKTELQLYDEALGSAAYITAGLFLYWSAIAELTDAIKSIYDALDDISNISDDTVENLINKAKKADEVAAETLPGDPPEEVEDELTEEQIEKLQIFLKQCALLLNMNTLKEAYQKEFTKTTDPNDYGNLIHTIDTNDSDTRSNLVTKLASPPVEKIETFLRMTPEIQSALVPKLRFFKVYNTDKEIKEVEFSFPRHYDPNDTRYFLDNSGEVFRGGGSGIKSFSFSFEGTTPATARNDIQADLVLFFQDFKDLTKKRKTDSLFDIDEGKGEEFSYIELLLLPGSKLKGAMQAKNKYESHFASFDASEHRIRVDVGWTVRDDALFTKIIKERGFLKKVKGATGEKPSYINRVKEAINLINKSYYLNMVDHNIDFQEDGSVEITVNYRAYFETISKSSSLDALLTPELARERIALGKEYETIITDDELCKDPKEFEQLIRTYEALESRYVKKSHQSIINRLIKRNKLHYCLIEKTSVEEFRKNGYFPSTPMIVGSGNIQSLNVNPDIDVAIETVTDEEDPKAAVEIDVFHDSHLINLEGMSLGPATEEGFVTFFYFGDLIHVVLDCLRDPFSPDGKILPHLNKNKIILSSFNYLDNANKQRSLNLSEVPIATEYFFEWMNQNVIKPKRKAYPLTYFIRDLCNKLVVDLLLEQCINRSPVKSLSFKTLNLIGKGKFDPFITMDKISNTNHFDITKAYNDGKLPLESNIGEGSINDAFNFIVIYPVTEIVSHMGRGKYHDDGKDGIYHFVLGQNDGIVKTMKFNKTDIQGIREARFFNHGHDGLMQLSAVYKVYLH